MLIQTALERSVFYGYTLKGYKILAVRVDGYSKPPPIIKVSLLLEINGRQIQRVVPLELLLMDPFWWQCFGQSQGWYLTKDGKREWLYRWLEIIKSLAMGKSIGDYFSVL